MSFVTLKERRSLAETHSEIVREIWPQVMRSSGVARKHWPKLDEYFGEYQLFLVAQNGDVTGFANTIPFFWDQDLNQLPDEGWDWLIQKGISDYEEHLRPNCLGGLQIGVSKKYQRKGYSRRIIEHAKNVAFVNEFRNFVIPIRPVLKSKYPLIELTDYIHWKKDGKTFDPWIRVHLQSGAEIIKKCAKSMAIEKTVEQWEEISGLSILGSGRYIVEGAGSPVDIDVMKNTGVYYDENIWIYYGLK